MSFFDKIFEIPDINSYGVTGLNKELTCINIYDTFIEKNKGILVVTSSTYVANLLYQTLLNYTDKVLFFPMDDFLTSEAIAVSPEFKVERINTLNMLVNSSKYIVVTNLMGALRYLPCKDIWRKNKVSLSVGMEISRDKLVESLISLGYEREILVNGTGDIGVRGYVLDIFPTSCENPVRIEFWGNEIDSIKTFSVDSQRTISSINEIDIYPFSEFILDVNVDNVINKQKYLKYYSKNVNSIFDYLDNEIICYYDYKSLLTSYFLLLDSVHEYDISNKSDIPTDYMFNLDYLKGNREIYYYHFDDDINSNHKCFRYNIGSSFHFNGDYNYIASEIKKYINDGKTVILCISNTDSVNRIIKYLDEIDIILTDENKIIDGKVNLINKDIYEGFSYLDYVVLGKNELFMHGDNVVKYKSKYRIGTRVHTLSNIENGDYVVHEMFGIGIYQGLESISKQGIYKDYIKIIYADGDSLYIPVENIGRISKFTGKEGCVVKLNSLANDAWSKKKVKVREKLASIAKDLLLVSANREMSLGYAFSKDDENQTLFESEFVYAETPDQIKAINLIKSEMEKPKPMDMLLCGDVGYGKTEVAFRAMFKAVRDSKQVAYLCPTTILSNQQYESAKIRFSNFPVRIALLNRFTPKNLQNEIIEGLKTGKIDIVMGTHRILSSDIEFKDLGLLVIDEEQRFGVTHKEKIKQIKSNVDVLTLSATPIPRTLQMSMSGIRSLALIETPPKERYPIQTYVLEESNLVIRDAIYKELSRDGQVFILFNDVGRILDKVTEINKLVPEAKIEYAHGRMTKEQIENKMNNFISGKYNILVCTTIIETGIDIPNVNTLIILDADRFGLSQLYQIRGRIGRSNKIGYAYLMYSKYKFLSDIAIKRLDTIKEFTELGSGFKIAMRDLSIRGAGSLLGREQSGFIDSVGIDLYLKMLNDEIRRSKGEDVDLGDNIKSDKPLINVSTHIDDNYVSDTPLKLIIHKKINQISSKDSFDSVKLELEDRFGKLSDDLIIYMYLEWFDKLARSLGIDTVVDSEKFVSIKLPSNISDKIRGDDLFYESYNISKNFKLNYFDNCISIILNKSNLEKHYLIYLIDILKIVYKMVNEE